MTDIQELKKRYENLFPIEGVEDHILVKIEKMLNIELPDDFRKIASFYSGGLLGGISHFAIAFEGITPNIVEETARLRAAINLPSRFMVLAEPSESLIVMDTKAKNKSSVIWCDATDVIRLDDTSFISTPETWDTYSEFFATLLEDEEGEADE
jgi:hypothetical protein